MKETENAPAVEKNAPAVLKDAPAVSENAPAVLKTRKPRKTKSKNMIRGKSPVIGFNGNSVNPGDNERYMMLNAELMAMPDIDMCNAEEVRQRLVDFFKLYAKYDTKPTVVGMAISLNSMSRVSLTAIAHNRKTGSSEHSRSALPDDVKEVITRGYLLMENLWENYMQNGKFNPVTGIFLGKNNFGYQDKSEYVVTPNQKTDSDYSVEEIKERYVATSDYQRLSQKD